jgi:hypothetical protein
MSKQQAKIIDLSKYDSLIQEDTSSNVETIDLSKYDSVIQPVKKKDVTASSGQEDSTGLFSDIANYFATAKPVHSGLGVSQTNKELESNFQYNPKKQLTQEEALLRKKSLAQRAAIDDVVTSTLLRSTPYDNLLDNFLGKPLASGGLSLVGMATNVLGGAVDFFQNVAVKSYDAVKKGQIGTGYTPEKKATSEEGLGGGIYDFAQNLQNASNSFMRQAKVDRGIKNEDVDKGYSELIQEGKVGDAFTTLGLSVVQQIPQMVALASTGGSAGATFAGATLMGTGSSLGEEYAKDKDIEAKDALVAIGKGVVEGATESIFRTDIAALNKLKSLITTEGKEAVKEEFIRSFGGVIKKALSGAGEEGMEEVIANLGGTIIDSAADDKFDPKRWNDLIQTSIDSFVLGAASGGVMSGMVAKAALTPLTDEQERQIKRYKEVATNDSFSEDIRKAATQKIDDIIKDNANETNSNYRLIADIEDVNKRAEVIKNLNEIKDEESKQRELHDESLVAASNQIIEDKKARVDSIIQENIENIFGRSAEGIKQEQKAARERAANYLDNNNYYLGFTENNAGLLDSINNNEEVDVREANKATASLYDLEASVIADDSLTNQERNYILRDIYARIDSVEGYDKITKNGVALTESEIESNRASNSKVKEERVKRVRNDRFDGELFKFTTEDGIEMSLRASVNEKGDVTMKPIRKSFRYKTETEAKANEGFNIKGNLQVGEIKRNQDGDIISATLTDSKTKKSFRTNNEELVSYLQSVQARESLAKTAKEGYVVDSDIETVAGNDVLSRVTPYTKTRLKNYAASLKSINPNARIVLYKSDADMAKGLIAQGIKPARARKAAKGAMGLQYNNVVHANVSVMDDSTIGHEVFHLAVRDISRVEPAEFVKMVNKLSKMLKSSNNKYLTNFANLYEGEELKAEEFLSELLGVLTAKRLSFKTKNADGDVISVEVDFELKRTLMQKIVLALREFVQKYAAKTGNKTLMDLANKIGEETNTTEKLAQFFESFAKSLREGTAVDMSYINQLDMKVEKGSVEQIRLQKGVEEVQKNASEYKSKEKIAKRAPEPVYELYADVSSMMAKAYADTPTNSKEAKVVAAYDALESETIHQYDFIISKGLKVEKYYGEGEPYENSTAMLDDLRNNNTLKFLPNENAFGEDINKVSDNRGLKPSGRFLEDNYELTVSEVFRVVHDYFGHGILGNQFGAIGEENATLQHLDLYSNLAAPAVIFQTRGQNSWVNFSGENTRAAELRKEARKLSKEGKQEESKKLLEEANKIFKFAEPKENIFPNKFNFKQYESARRISEQEKINTRATPRDNDVPELLATYVGRSSGTRGINKRNIRKSQRLGSVYVDVIAEYTFDDKINEGIMKAFPSFKGVQKVYETKDAKAYRDMMIASLENHKFAASVTVYSEEDFSKLRMFITEDGSTGVTLGKDGLLGGAFSDPKSSKPNNLAQLMVLGIKEGATIADAFDTILPDYYANFGFKAVARTEFNDEFKPTKESGTSVVDWDYDTYKSFNNGKPDLVFFIYDGNDRNTIEDRLGLFDIYSKYEKANTQFFAKEEYDSADMYAKKEAVKRLAFELEENELEPIKQQLTNKLTSGEEISNEIEEKVHDGSLNEIEFIPQKKILYHGSPYKFNKFNNAKIGTGEGAQAYGWGIYLSEDPEVAQSYAMSNQGNKMNRLNYLDFLGKDLQKKAYKVLQNPNTKLTDWKRFLEDNKGFLGLNISRTNRDKLYNAFGERNYYTAEVTGQMVNDGVWFDWHRSGYYNQQSATTAFNGFLSIQRALRMMPYKDQYTKDTLDVINFILNEYNGGGRGLQFLSQKGSDVYESIQYRFASMPYANKSGNNFLGTAQQMTSWLLQQAGVDGIRVPTYYAQGGRNDGLNNYVVFDAEAIRIKNINSIRAQLTGVDKSVLLDQDLLADSRKSVKDRQNKTLVQWLKSNYKSIYKGAFERNINIRKELEKADMIYALQMMYNKAGASQFAQLKFAQASNEIYGKLSKEEKAVLDTIIQLRRIIKIDENFDNQRSKFLSMIENVDNQIQAALDVITNSESTEAQIAKAKRDIINYKEELARLKRKAQSKIRPKHGKYKGNKQPNKESSEASLDKMKGSIGEEAYDELNKRADLYFKTFSDLLKYKFDNGLINEATYNMFKDYDYQPRNFLKFSYGQLYQDADGNFSVETPIDANSFITRGTIINADEMKNIESGDSDYLEADSAKLLHAAMVTAEIRVATNNALKALAESSTLANYGFIKEAEYERYADGKIKVDRDGVPKFIAPSDNTYKNMVYKVDGKKYAFQIKDTEEMPLVEEFNDARSGDFKTSGYKFVSKLLLSNLMKVIATGTNIAFPITNIPIDVISQVHLNDIYTGTVGEQYAQAMSGTLDMAKQLTKMKFNKGDNTEIRNLLYEFGQAGGLMQSLTQEYAPDFGGKAGQVVDALGVFGNISELASKLNAYKTSRDILLDEYYAKNGREAQDKDLSKIKTEAAYKSRAAMDYHRGGNWAKYFDGFAPYFNVMLQVGKITASYIKNNPIEFSKKLAQSGAFVMAVTMYNLMVASDDYDNDDVQRDLLNNLVIFNPYKNEDGTRGYTKIAVPSFVKMSLNFFQNFAESLYAEEIVRDNKMAKKFDEKHKVTKSMIPMLMPKLGTAIPPAMKSVIEYTTNYDFYKGQQIVDKDSRNPTSPFLEGVKDKSVAEFWKVLAATETGKYLELSPARLQKAANNILPLTNPYISMGYSIVDKSVNSVANLPENYRSKFDKNDSWTSIPASIPNAIKERFTGVTDPTKRFVNKEYESIRREEADKMFEMHSQIKGMVENNASISDILKYAKEQGSEYRESAKSYAMNLRKREKINYRVYEPDYFAMAFAPNAKAKAEIMYEFEQKNDIPNMKLYRRDLIRFGILTPNVNRIYKELKDKEK